MNIIVTGATGYIGTKLIKRLSEEGYRIYAVIRKSSDIKKIEKYVSEVIYIESYIRLYTEMKNIRPEMYINLAGVYCGSHTPEKIMDLFEGNVLLPAYLTDAVVQAGCLHVIHTASYQQCYNGEKYNPINFYAATKQAFEDILYYYTMLNRINAITLQLFDTYGVDDDRNKVFNLVRRLHNGESIKLSPGMQKLYFCYIDDVVEAYIVALDILQKEQIGYNKRYAVRGIDPITLKKFVESYIKITQKQVNLEWGKREYMMREIMDPTGYGEVLPEWEPKISYTQGICLCGEYDLGVQKNESSYSGRRVTQ